MRRARIPPSQVAIANYTGYTLSLMLYELWSICARSWAQGPPEHESSHRNDAEVGKQHLAQKMDRQYTS